MSIHHYVPIPIPTGDDLPVRFPGYGGGEDPRGGEEETVAGARCRSRRKQEHDPGKRKTLPKPYTYTRETSIIA